MEEKIVAFRKPATEHDPVADRAMFFADLEITELAKTIPQAVPAAPKVVY